MELTGDSKRVWTSRRGLALGANLVKVCTDTGARTPVKLYRHNTDSWVLGSSSFNPMELTEYVYDDCATPEI